MNPKDGLYIGNALKDRDELFIDICMDSRSTSGFSIHRGAIGRLFEYNRELMSSENFENYTSRMQKITPGELCFWSE